MPVQLRLLTAATSPEYMDAMPEVSQRRKSEEVAGVTAAHVVAEFELRYELGRPDDITVQSCSFESSPSHDRAPWLILGRRLVGLIELMPLRGKFESGMDGRPREVDPRSMFSARKPNTNLSTFVVNFIGLALPMRRSSRRHHVAIDIDIRVHSGRISHGFCLGRMSPATCLHGMEARADGAVECSGAISVIGTFPRAERARARGFGPVKPGQGADAMFSTRINHLWLIWSRKQIVKDIGDLHYGYAVIRWCLSIQICC
ncbi:hypothetical protein B0H17DRAFT_1149172 [Mycena rosella]|uniref:Uncharacterized protein n=1 Tax=Mycena rosella TaxID=1033263 RepID=A0AAD7FUN1_MYCRO|nr:hypothetical protein B0H17DRAFT_1149172 [Mycena rosella]